MKSKTTNRYMYKLILILLPIFITGCNIKQKETCVEISEIEISKGHSFSRDTINIYFLGAFNR